MGKIHLRSITLGSCLHAFGIILGIVLVIWYITFQARNFLSGPLITINDSNESVQHTRIIPVSGTAKNIVKLTLNGREIHTNERGEFTQSLVLENGYTIMTLDAQDRFGRTTSLTRAYVYTPQSS